MRVNVVCCVLLALTFNLFATTSNGQNINRTYIKLGLEATSLRSALKKVEKESGISIFFPTELVDKYNVKSLESNKRTVTQTLTLLLQNTDLGFKQSGKNVVISQTTPQRTREESERKNESVVQQRKIKGQVLSENGRPLVAVTVSVKNWTSLTQEQQFVSRTASDADGLWSLPVPTDTCVLIFSLIGYQSQEVRVGNKTEMRVILREKEATAIEDVVVTGLFTRKAESFTGSATTFSQDDIIAAGAQNVLQSLRNLDPAFQITENLELGSDPNAMPNVQLRGQSGLPDLQGEYLTNPNQPLFILDGFETTIQKVVDLDIYRVKSVTLLKDAASKAIYGSRAANGVVVIETLRPEAGKLRFTYNTNINLQLADIRSYNLTDAREKLQAEVLAGIYSNSTSGDGQYALKEWYNQNLQLVEQGVNTDWLSKPLRNGLGQRHSLRAEGGDESMRYGVDLMYNDIKGAMKGSDRQSFNGAVDLTYRTKKFSFNNILTITNNIGTNSPWGSFAQYAAMNPYLPYQDSNGNILKVINRLKKEPGDGGSVVSSEVYNPAYNSLLNILDNSKYTDITNNFNVDYNLMPGLIVRGRFTLTKQLNGADQFLPADHTNFVGSDYSGVNINRRGSYTKANGEVNNFSGNLLANYIKRIENHLLTVNGGFDANSFSSFSNSYTVEGFPNDRMDFVSLAMQYMRNTRPTGTESTVRDLSALISTNYTYDDRYLADLSYRGTQSSQFGRNNPWGQFWSAGLGWNLHNEPFIQSLGIFDQLRLRMTTGYTGSQNFNSSISLATYSYYLQNPYYTSGNGANLIGLANPDLKWQRKRDNNFGIDFTVFKRLNVRADYYISITDGLITDINLPPSNGFSTFKANLGKVENNGFDLRADYRIINQTQNRHVLTIFGMLSHNKNTLKEISNSLKEWNDRQDQTVSNAPRLRFIEGQSMNAIWAVQSQGIDPSTGREVYLTKDGEPTYVWNPADQIVAGDALPKLYGNFGFNWQWNGWQLNTSFRYQWGGSVYNQTLVNKVENANIYQNVDKRVLSERWRNPGDVSFFKNIANQSTTRATTRFIADNNLLSLAALDIRYDLDRLVELLHLNRQ